MAAGTGNPPGQPGGFMIAAVRGRAAGCFFGSEQAVMVVRYALRVSPKASVSDPQGAAGAFAG